MRSADETRRAHARQVLSAQDACEALLRTVDSQHLGVLVNLSTHGAGILLPAELPPGTSVIARLTNASKLFSCDLELRVIHSTRESSGHFLTGCEFAAALSHETVRALVS
jgi:hypothetical protein